MPFSAGSSFIGITVLLFVLGMVRVEAFTGYFTAFTTLYPQTVGTRIGNTSCMVCHTLPSSGPRNPYGSSFEARSNHATDPSAALIAIEATDSDGDNFNNITEIRDLSFPWASADVPAAPSVSINSPASGTTYTTGQTVQLGASASDNVGVTRVEFYDGATLRGTDTGSPYTFSWTFTSADNGTHAWTARAFDAAGLSRTSAVANLTVNIDVTPPTVAITNPPAATTYATAQTVLLGASASDNVGVTRVEFYDGAMLRGTDTGSPYTFSWSFTSADNGTHAWTARAFDAAGLSRTSAVVNLTVNTALGTPTNIAALVSGTNLTLFWPSNRIGSRLLAQTNRNATGISTNLNDFATVAGSTATNRVIVPIDRNNRTTFYRLIYP